MKITQRVVQSLAAAAVVITSCLSAGCIVAQPHEGYYDHDHHRYYREHTWHECRDHDEYCR
jgi:hypothetical protein